MRRTLLIVALACIALAAMASAVMAENAPWWRGQNNTARMNWTPQAGVTFFHVGTGLYNRAPSVTVGENYVSASLPNFMTNNPGKLMRIQVWWVPVPGGTKPTFDTVNGIYGMPGGEHADPFTIVNEYGDQFYSLSDWEIQPNPYWEQISLGTLPGTMVNQIIIDTWCVPEPSSIIALLGGLGSLLAFRRRRA